MLISKFIKQAFNSLGYTVKFDQVSGRFFITSSFSFPDLKSLYHFYFGLL